jgi:hypothetical protein
LVEGIFGKNPRKLHRIWKCNNGDLSEFWSTRNAILSSYYSGEMH